MYGLDLFSGIGGITKALEGYVQPIAYCENDRYAQAVLLTRMADGSLPSAPIWDDVQTLDGRQFIGQVDIIYGGFPCQDISVAGRGAGLEGKRSGLFFEIVRLAEEIKPRFIFLENVANIRSKGLGRVLEEMARLGYDTRFGILSASDVGAPHRRDRWWLLAYRLCSDGSSQHGEQQTERTTLIDSSSKRELADSDESSEQRLSRRKKSELSGASGQCHQRNGWWDVEPRVGRVANGIPKRVDRLRALGNAVVPLQAREAFERLIGFKV